MKRIGRNSPATRRLARFAFVALWLGACGGGAAETDLTVTPWAPDVTLGPGDTFEVNVYGEKDLSGKFQVADDGTINFPLIGTVKAAGQLPTEVARAIQTQLAEKQILRNPSVSIMVLDYASKRISVMGAVGKPGSLPLTAGMTVVQAISTAGGLTSIAASNEVIVTRQVDGKLKRFKVGVKRVTEGRERDFPLQAGDIIYVPERIF